MSKIIKSTTPKCKRGLTPYERFLLRLGERFIDVWENSPDISNDDYEGRILGLHMLCETYWADDIESPIEQILWAEIMFCTDGYSDVDVLTMPEEKYQSGTWVSPQYSVGPYRVDFLFCCTFGGHKEFLVVECDGHDFHEKTKSQAAKDKARDRFFTKSSYKVLRFTGSEIFADPEKCREDIDATLAAMMTDLQDRFGGK